MFNRRALPFVNLMLAALCAVVALSSCVIIDGTIMPANKYSGVGLVPKEPRCEDRKDPLGVDSPAPVLSWSLSTVDRNARGMGVSARRVIVSASPIDLAADKGEVWDSRRIQSGACRAVYEGDALESGKTYWWKAMVWDQTGASSGWSEPASFTMGMLAESDWSAKWIRRDEAPIQGSFLLRRDFEVKPGLVRATLNICGLGAYEFTLNGKKITGDLMTPGWTDYRKTALYNTYEVARQLQQGKNAAGILIGNSFYDVLGQRGRYVKLKIEFGPQKAIAQLRLDYADGTTETIGTDNTWSTHEGPLTYSNVYGGEDYDGRLEPAGWNNAGFAGAGRTPAVECEGPGGALRGLSRDGWPVRAFETFSPVSQKKIDASITVYDLGQNASIMPFGIFNGPAGSTVRIYPTELIKPDGRMDDTATRGNSYWSVTLPESGRIDWMPKFFYRGGRWLQVECIPAAPGGALPSVEGIAGRVVHIDAPSAGEFSCSNPLFNQIFTLVRWAQRSNMFSSLTDCPHREKLGWLEQDHLNGPSLRYDFNLDPQWEKIMDDVADAQQDNGLVPSIAPEYTVFGWWGDMQFRESPEWGSACVLIPWQHFRFTGDRDFVKRHYAVMKKYMDYLGTLAPEGILSMPGSLGDWYDIGPGAPGKTQLTPVDLTATAIYYEDAMAMAKMADIAGESGDAQNYATLAGRVRDAFNAKYFDAARGQYSTGSQTANAMPFALGMVPVENRQSVLDTIVSDVRAKNVTAGDVGYRYLLRALADGGRSDVIYELNNQSDKPGYGYQLKMGATSLTEAWSARRANSQNHFMLGQIIEWFYHDLAGIQPSAERPGFARFIVAPAMPGDLTWAKASYNSSRGRIESAWKREGGRVAMDIVVPPNAVAEARIPAPDENAVTESGQPLASAPGVRSVKFENGLVICEIGSGSYHFETPQAAAAP